EIPSLCERLRDRLSVADRQRHVLVRPVAHRLGHEQMPRRLGERLEDGEIADALQPQRFDQPHTVPAVGVAPPPPPPPPLAPPPRPPFRPPPPHPRFGTPTLHRV